jgi:hypothetical protein
MKNKESRNKLLEAQLVAQSNDQRHSDTQISKAQAKRKSKRPEKIE